jgi:hypothetical protein
VNPAYADIVGGTRQFARGTERVNENETSGLVI